MNMRNHSNTIVLLLAMLLSIVPQISYACNGTGNEEIGGFTLCFEPNDAIVSLDRNIWFSTMAPPGARPSEAYTYNFPSIEDVYPCVDNVDVEEVIVTITINSASVNLPPALACCEDHINGIFANMYQSCPYGQECQVIGDGLRDDTNPGNGDCSPSGDHLVYMNGNFPAGLPYTSTVTCLGNNFAENENLSIDIFFNFIFEQAANAGCTGCPQDAISQGYVDIDFDVSYEFIYCSNDLDETCRSLTFDPITDVCDSDGIVTLPFSSNEGIFGTWSPNTFLDVSAAGGSTVTATFTPSPGECSTTPVSIDIEVDKCCTVAGGELTPDDTQTVCSSGGIWQNLQLEGVLSAIVPDDFSFENMYLFLLVDANGTIIDNENILGALSIPENTSSDPEEYCLYGISYKAFPGLGSITNGTTSINVGDPNALTDGAGNPIELNPDVDAACLQLSDNCVSITVEAPSMAPMVDNIDTCEGGDTEIVPSGSGTNFNFYDSADLSNLLSSGASYDPAPAGGTTTEIWVTEGNGPCESAATMLTITIIDGQDPGENNSLELCTDNDQFIDLFASLNGTPEAGGSWTDDDNSGVDLSTPDNIDISGLTAGDYCFTYSFAAANGCPEVSATVSFSIGNPVDAGMDTEAPFCTGDVAIIDFINALNGSPSTGGTWADLDNTGLDLSDPQNVDISTLTAGSYDFEYTITGTGSCTDESSKLTITLEEVPSAGMNGTSGICEGGTSIIDLFGALNGNPDASGSWTDNDNTGVDLSDPNNVDFAGVASGDYTFTYTVTGTLCSDASAEITINIGSAPDAGENNSIELCTGDTPTLDFLFSLSGNPNAGGTWNDDDNSGLDLSDPNNVDLSALANGSYNFTYFIAGPGDCPDAQAELNLMISTNPEAGTNGTASICEGGNSIVDLFGSLGGTPEMGGTWNDDDNIGVDLSDPSSVDFASIANGDYNFTYSLNGGFCDDGTATVSISIGAAPQTGQNGSTTICSDQATVNLLTVLQGTPDAGGAWTDDDQTGVDLSDPSSVDFSNIPSGSYDFNYTIAAAGDCPASSSTASITIEGAPNAGEDNGLSFCENQIGFINILGSLNGIPEQGGTWQDVNNSGADITNPNMVDFDNLSAGTYAFAYTVDGLAPCDPATATLTITIEAGANAGSDQTEDICEGDASTFNFYTLINASTNPNGLWTDDSNAGVNLSDPMNVSLANLAPGNYTFTHNIPNNGACPGSAAILSINVEARPNSGVSNAMPGICADQSEIVDLSSLLDGEDANGVWTETSSTPSQGGAFDAANSTFNTANQSAGIYTFVYSLSGNGNCQAEQTEVTVEIIASPMVDLGANIDQCVGDGIITLNAQNAGATFLWTSNPPGAINNSSDQMVSINDQAFSGTVSVSVDQGGCVASDEITINILALPRAQELSKTCSADLSTYEVTIDSDATTIIPSQGMLIDNMDGTFTITGIPVGTNISFEALIQNSNCSMSFDVSAPDCNCPNVPSPTAANESICESDGNIPAFAASTEPGLQVNWYADANGTNLLAENTLTYTPPAGGIYYLQAIDPSNNCMSVLVPVELIVNPLPTLQVLSNECASDLNTYVVTFQTDADILNPDQGDLIDNMDGTFSIINIPIGVDLNLIFNSSLTNCNNAMDIESPDCNCPSINSPVGMDQSICEGDAIPTLEVIVENGLDVNWYADAGATDLLQSNSSSFSPPAGGTYYVQAVDPGNNCTSDVIEVNLDVNDLPTFQLVSNTCSSDLETYEVLFNTNADQIIASNGMVIDQMDGSFLVTGIPIDENFVVEYFISSTGCSDNESIDAPDCDCPMIPEPSAMGADVCEGENFPTLNASAEAGLNINWYADANGTVILEENSTTYDPDDAGTFYIEAIDPLTSCSSALVPVIFNVNPLPTFAERQKTCSADLSSYTVVIETTADQIQTMQGDVVDNGDGTFNIENIAGGADASLQLILGICVMDVIITAPNCDCPSFDVPVIEVFCDDNGTPGLEDDDVFTYTINLSSIGLGNAYSIIGMDTQNGLTYGEIQGPFGPFLISDGALNISIVDDTNSDCTINNFLIEAPVSCSACNETADAGPSFELNCGMSSVTLEGTASSPGMFNWTGPNGLVETNVENPMVSEAGIYTLTVMFTNGCTAVDQVEVFEDPNEPIADAGLDQVITCTEDLISLGGMGTSVGQEYEYIWTGPNGFMSNELNPEVTEPGTYTLTVEDVDRSCTSEVSTVDVMDDRNQPTALITTDPTTPSIDCMISSIQLAAADNGMVNVVYEWDFNGTLMTGLNIMADEAGTYVLTVVDTLTGCVETAEIEVLLNVDFPVLEVQDFDPLDCNNESTLIEVFLPQVNSTTSFQWTDLNGNVLSSDSTLEVMEAGTYVFTAVDGDNGCTNADTITVNENIDLPMVDAGEDQQINCLDMTATLNGSTDLPTAFEIIWNTAQGGMLEDALEVNVTGEGWYFLTVLNTLNGCAAVDSVLVLSAEMPESASIEVEQADCTDPFGQISINEVSGGTGPYLFSLDEGMLGSGVVFTNLEADTYMLNVEDANGCQWDTLLLIEDFEDVNIELGDNQSIAFGDSLFISPSLNIALSEVDSIIWSGAGGLSCTDCLTPFLSPLNTTTYSVEIIDENGCVSVDEITIFVERNLGVYIPTGFSPNEDGRNDFFTVFTGNNVANITNFEVYNRWGETVYTNGNISPADLVGWDGSFREVDMPADVYVYKITVEYLDGSFELFQGDVTLVR